MVEGYCTVVLAAGKGTRMKSEKPKVLHEICDKAMLWYVIKAVAPLSREQVVVVGHESERVKAYLEKEFKGKNVKTAFQEEQLGTGHAVMKAEKEISQEIEDILIVMGDTPLILTRELDEFISYHRETCSACTVLTAKLSDPSGYGRIYRDEGGEIKAIVEDKDANEYVKAINEINTGIYCFKKEQLFSILSTLSPSEFTGEYYLTDVIKLLKEKGQKVTSKEVNDFNSVIGVNDRRDLAKASRELQERINDYHMKNGVTIIYPENTFIDPLSQIGEDTVIYPGTYIEKGCKIGGECVLGPDSKISDSHLMEQAEVVRSSVEESVLNSGVKIGPYARIRPGSRMMKGVKIGDFVEVKNSYMGEGSKASHLSYIGDAEIGKDVNLGAGTVIVNYDGQNKFKTVIEDGAFIGCNSSLIAPLTIKERAFVAAGSTITEDVEEKSLAIARQKQVVKEGWRKKHDN